MNQNFFNLSTQKKLVMDATMLAALQRDAVRRALEHNQISDADIRSTMEALSLNSTGAAVTVTAAPKGKKRGPKTMIAYNPTTGDVVGNMVDGTFVPNE